MASIYKANTNELKKAMIDSEITTISELAELTGVSRNTLSKVLSGDVQPSSEIMDRLVEVLKIAPEIAGRIFFSQHLRGA
jgi:transcriptional regulator with XRE-family HTH domain